MQTTLFDDAGKSKELVHIEVDKLVISELNSRQTRPQENVDRLADRIKRNGYELTRAMWVYPEDGVYKVFAGGTRLQASKNAGLDTVPCIVHKGFSEEEIVRLENEDNENDEYHTEVPIVDVWMSYKALADMGWTQQRIADAKGVNRRSVGYKLSFASFPKSVIECFGKNDFLKESHANELLGLENFSNLSPWLTRETVMLYVIEKVTAHSSFTAKNFRTEVDKVTDAVASAQEFIEEYPEREYELLTKLSESKCRTVYQVGKVIDAIKLGIAREARERERLAIEAAEAAEAARLQAESEERRIKERQLWFKENVTLYNADFRDVQIQSDSIDMIFVDPPYDKNTVTLYSEIASYAKKVLKPGGSLITYAGHYAIPQIINLMSEHLRYWWLLAVKHGGNNARLPGKFVYVEWKPLLWFVKGNRSNRTFVSDFYQSKQPDKQYHEWQQDTSEAQYYIEQLTEPGDTVLDMCAGGGSTLIAALDAKRKVIGIEINTDTFKTLEGRLDAYYQSRQ